MTFVLGLTGSIATGKSTVTHFFEQQGIPIVDSDIIAREVVEPGTPGLRKITEHFGPQMIHENGSLDRKKLGTLVFSNPKARVELDELLKPELKKAIGQAIKKWQETKVDLIVVDVPLLYEAQYEAEVDQIMVVYVPEAVQLERLMKRDQLSIEEAQKRINSQLSIEIKRQRADIVINNMGSIAETEEQLGKWLLQLKETKKRATT